MKGVVLVNTGNYNLPTDLLFRFAEYKLKREWHDRYFRSIDFVSCLTMDMFRDGFDRFYAKHIQRPAADEAVRKVAAYLYERWVHYAAPAFGAEVSFEEGLQVESPPADLTTPFAGKLVWRRGDSGN